MDETVRPLRIPPEIYIYADKYHISHLIQTLVTALVINQPEDPITFLIEMLERTILEVPRILILGPSAVGKLSLAKRLSSELRVVLVHMRNLVVYNSGLTTHNEQGFPKHRLIPLLCQRLKEIDCLNRGWVMVGIVNTHWQAVQLQQAGVLPDRVVLLEAPDDVLMERNRGRLVDPVRKEIYHETFILPTDDIVMERLRKGRRLKKEQFSAELQRYRCEITGVKRAYEHALKVFDGDQPLDDIVQQVLTYVKTRYRSRTPRILLIGPPGCGRSHQAQLLTAKYNLVNVCCGHLLLSMANSGLELGQEIQSYMDVGRQVSDSLVHRVLTDRLSRLDCSCRGWVLHSFPRTLQQAKSLQESYLQPNRVYFLNVPDEVCRERLRHRVVDPVTGDMYNLLTLPPPSADVLQRLQTLPKDQDENVIENLKRYRIQIDPMKIVYADGMHINGDQDPHTVFEELESRLLIE